VSQTQLVNVIILFTMCSLHLKLCLTHFVYSHNYNTVTSLKTISEKYIYFTRNSDSKRAIMSLGNGHQINFVCVLNLWAACVGQDYMGRLLYRTVCKDAVSCVHGRCETFTITSD
jgi:hypothetical protein